MTGDLYGRTRMIVLPEVRATGLCEATLGWQWEALDKLAVNDG